MLEPVELISRNEWRATDLFLDVWLGLSGRAELLDAAELEDAVRRGWIQENTAKGARAEAERIIAAANSGLWPPAVVHEWTLARVRGTLTERQG
jgi:predicted RNA-binding protein associated with RNAse of E/G family